MIYPPASSQRPRSLARALGLDDQGYGTLQEGGPADVAVLVVPLEQRGVAMVFQSYALYPHMTVFDTIAFSLQIQKLPKAKIEARVFDVVEKLQLIDYLDRQPSLLSGGQRQRVAIGRASVRDAKIFLFDEPLFNLDASLRVQMRMEITKLKTELPETTMINLTHDQVEAMTLADCIVVLHEGRIEAICAPLEMCETPKSVFIAGFIGFPKMNLVSGDLANGYGVHTVGVRPDAMTFVMDVQPGWAGMIAYVENLGSDTFAYIDVGADALMIVRLSGENPSPTGGTGARWARWERLSFI